jgi:hypothetical protein
MIDLTVARCLWLCITIFKKELYPLKQYTAQQLSNADAAATTK